MPVSQLLAEVRKERGECCRSSAPEAGERCERCAKSECRWPRLFARSDDKPAPVRAPEEKPMQKSGPDGGGGIMTASPVPTKAQSAMATLKAKVAKAVDERIRTARESGRKITPEQAQAEVWAQERELAAEYEQLRQAGESWDDDDDDEAPDGTTIPTLVGAGTGRGYLAKTAEVLEELQRSLDETADGCARLQEKLDRSGRESPLTSAEEEINRRADALVAKSAAPLSRAKAVALVCEDRELAARYCAERRAMLALDDGNGRR